MNSKRRFALGLLAVLVTGCTLSPEYTRPVAPVPATWSRGEANGEVSREMTPVKIPWEAFFGDPHLKELIAMALQQNRDLKLASLNVKRAEAIYGIKRAERYPSLNALGSMNKSRSPADLSSSGSATTSERYDVSLGISAWEIDFFGRLQDLKDQALEEFLATAEAQKSTQILLISAVANAYLALAADREALKLAVSTLEAQEGTYQLIRIRHKVGLASELDVRYAQSQVEAARGALARSRQQAAQDENALQLLVGTALPAPLLPLGLAGIGSVQEICPGLPSEVLLRRPDVMAVEHRLKGAYANIGAARKAFLPRISLTTSLGTASAELSGLFKAGSSTWSFAPAIALPIFDARTWSAYEVTKVEREILVAQYEKTIQTAFREVADALAVRGTVEEQLGAQQAVVAAIQETYRLAQNRYAKGVDSYLAVLDAQRSLLAAQQGLISLRLADLANRVTLYKVLGGGA